eukprot:TRINITY_DN53768_c0_g1_i1.p1 TRINITY_DN53768_c0_g1~~TRINITY_DN53768_c0_g1_i1.p1  ORF type:complete len:197 (-),score=13.67 TRINITY_DN53768_c0_g1_i1:709-1278(-)
MIRVLLPLALCWGALGSPFCETNITFYFRSSKCDSSNTVVRISVAAPNTCLANAIGINPGCTGLSLYNDTRCSGTPLTTLRSGGCLNNSHGSQKFSIGATVAPAVGGNCTFGYWDRPHCMGAATFSQRLGIGCQVLKFGKQNTGIAIGNNKTQAFWYKGPACHGSALILDMQTNHCNQLGSGSALVSCF